jgi:hypothetical protein
MAAALEANGRGEIHTVGPFDSHAFLPLFNEWPPELRKRTRFYAISSMDFFMEAERSRLWFDIVLVDGKHDYEFALYDIQCAARRMRRNGFIIIDNISQAGPYYAARDFLAQYPSWTDCGIIRDSKPTAESGPARAFDRQRSNIYGTDFMVLQAPNYYAVWQRPQTFGEISWDSPAVNGFKFTVLPVDKAGVICVEAVLRGFTNGPQSEVAAKAQALISPGQRDVTVPLEKPLESIRCDSYTLEPWLVWTGNSPIGLAELPIPY